MKRENIQMIGDNKNRFLLKKDGENILVVMGINPSTADDKKPDATMRKVMGFAEKNGYDGFAMINIIPQRATFPCDINPNPNIALMNKNHEVINNLMNSIKNPHILLAFGNTIDEKEYFMKRFKNIINFIKPHTPKFLKIGLTKNGNPLHPSRAGYCKLTDFNVDEYLKTKNK